jgi:hypothetical protein
VELITLDEAESLTAPRRVVERFAQHFDQSPDGLGLEQVREYLLHLLPKKKAVEVP